MHKKSAKVTAHTAYQNPQTLLSQDTPNISGWNLLPHLQDLHNTYHPTPNTYDGANIQADTISAKTPLHAQTSDTPLPCEKQS